MQWVDEVSEHIGKLLEFMAHILGAQAGGATTLPARRLNISPEY